jgi:Kef-type K+ transport system membrane component KefB
VQQNNPVAMLLLLLSAFSLAALALGIAPFLGAFVAGLAANRAGEDESGARETIQRFSFALPIPIYFAVVGLRLDLAESFDPIFFAGLLGFACAVKLASTYAGGRFAGESPAGALNLAVAMNARGGPGIVLASVALDAGIINESLYSSLVMLAIVTSLAAGSWLGLVVRRGWPLR